MPKSFIQHSPAGTTFVGPDATQLFKAAVLASALGLYAKTGIKGNRAYTPTKMLKAATQITGEVYKRGQYEKAAADLRVWCLVMKAALPVVEG